MDKIRPNYTLCFKYKSIGGLKANGGKKIKYLTDSKHKKIKMAVLASAVLCLVTQSYATLCNTMDCCPPGSSVHRDSPGKNTVIGCHALLQGIFPTQGSNPGLLHCKWILCCLSQQRSPRILECVAYPFSRESSQPRNRTGVSCIASRSFTS